MSKPKKISVKQKTKTNVQESHLWSSRFQTGLADDARLFSYSLLTDVMLLGAEIRVSCAHAEMLGNVGLIKKTEAKKLIAGLLSVGEKLSHEDMMPLCQDYEDIHSLIQERLEKKIGNVARKLHTGRSRNDLVTTSTRVLLKEWVPALGEGIAHLQSSLVALAVKYQDIAIPGYTHLQRAQPVLFAHHMLAYVEMFERDKGRLSDALVRMNECPLGSGALSGSALPLDRQWVAEKLGFKRPTANSMDAVSDRDYIVEILSSIALLFVHLSRFSEDLILWNSTEFGFIELSDRYATGSSLMPHKKNPDMAELIRGRSGKAVGSLMAILTMLKGLPMCYNRDMQEDKEPLFEMLAMAEDAVSVLAHQCSEMLIKEAVCSKAVQDSLLYTTDLVDYLILKGIAFRDAHGIVGRLVAHSMETSRPLKELPHKEFQHFSNKIDKDIYQIFNTESSLKRKKTLGSTHPKMVKNALAVWTRRLSK